MSNLQQSVEAGLSETSKTDFAGTLSGVDVSLKITEIFYSLQGEGLTAGLPTVFIRLTGCPLRCSYCDTAYAFSGGSAMSIAEILSQVAPHQTPHITVTGGEPLAQQACLPLLTALCDSGYQVSIETSGERDIGPVDSRVVKVMDLKTPGSGEQDRNRLENIELLTTQDQVKFVICSREDYLWARRMIAGHALEKRCHLLLSPAFGEVNPTELASWILADHLPVRLQLQLHKSLWGDEPGR